MDEDLPGPKYLIRLANLKPWHLLPVTCLQCRHHANVSPAPLLLRFGQYQRLVDLEDRFACSKCGNRWGNSVAVVDLNQELIK